MRWTVRGANRETGQEVEIEVEAASESEAVKKAGATGMLIESVRVQPGPTPSPPPAPQPGSVVFRLCDVQRTMVGRILIGIPSSAVVRFWAWNSEPQPIKFMQAEIEILNPFKQLILARPGYFADALPSRAWTLRSLRLDGIAEHDAVSQLLRWPHHELELRYRIRRMLMADGSMVEC